MKWRKLGLVWKPDGSMSWARTHATCPTPVWLADGTLRVYIQCRDEDNVGRIGFVDLDPVAPRRVLRISETPVLDIGAPGAFDDNGVFQCSVTKVDDGRLFMYYVGFELCHHVRYRLLSGLAVSVDGGWSFERVKSTPILERSDAELLFRCGPFVLSDHDRFRMWYVGGSRWVEIGSTPMPIYDLRYLESEDGIHWPDQGRVILSITEQDEHGFGRPYVIRDGDLYRMFYSIRKRSLRQYCMGYAESKDGFHWIRHDDLVGLTVSPEGWDSKAVEYAAVLKIGERILMFYNGNDFGATGFGMAELQSE